MKCRGADLDNIRVTMQRAATIINNLILEGKMIMSVSCPC